MTQIRDATPADAGAIAAVGRTAFVRQYEGLVDPANYESAVRLWYADEAVERSIRQCQSDPAALFIVAERDGTILGFLHYDETGPQPELHRIYVAADERGSGIGGMLITALHERLLPGATYVLAVVEGNNDAVRFYERHGLTVQGRVGGHGYYRETGGIVFPDGAEDFGLVVMRYG